MVSFLEILHSYWNSFWFFIRRSLRFKRTGYSEETQVNPIFHPEAAEINAKYNFTLVGQKLSPPNWHRNLATLWYFEQMLESLDFHKSIKVMETGCQNFSRLPSIDSYLSLRGWQGSITGVEIDAYVPAKNFYSLWDHAQYYRSLIHRETNFKAEDFFGVNDPSDLLICFYPFVSKAPALAWGIPASYASADKWLKAFVLNLKENGFLLLIHQGLWEQEEFDQRRESYPLRLIKREELKCPFFSTKYPAIFSLYQKI